MDKLKELLDKKVCDCYEENHFGEIVICGDCYCCMDCGEQTDLDDDDVKVLSNEDMLGLALCDWCNYG